MTRVMLASAGFASLRIVLIILVFWLLGPRADPESERIFSLLAEFIRNGQLIIETMPALSFLFVSWTSQHVFLLAASLQCVAFTLAALSFAKISKHSSVWLPLSFVIALYSWRLNLASRSEIGVLGATSGLADSLSLLAFLLVGYEAELPRRGLLFKVLDYGAGELFGVAACFFGCDSSQSYCFVFILIVRLFQDFNDTKSSSKAVAFRVLRKFSTFVVLLLSVALFAYGTLLPQSETAFTGNYHLNKLPPSTRRLLRAQLASEAPNNSSVQNWNSTSPYTIVAGVPYSMYIPGAGFLFADNLVWDPFRHGFVQDIEFNPPDDEDAYAQLTQTGAIPAAHHRVFFEDRLGVEIPWQILEVGKNTTNFSVKNPKYSLPLRSGSYVLLRHIESGEFLTVEPEVFSVVDRELMVEPGNDGFKRLHVSLSKELTPSVVWFLTYDPDKDTGLRLFSPDSECYLSTSFRSFPDFHGLRSNDSVLDELAMDLEAACINAPSDRAQTFYLIDGLQVTDPYVVANDNSMLTKMRNFVTRAWGIYQAVRLLSEFRTLFPDLQDVPRSLLKQQFTEIQPEREDLLNYSFLALLLLWGIRLLYRQRFSQYNVHATPQPQFITWAEIGVWLAVTRLSFFALNGYANGTSARVAGVLSVHSWMSLYQSLVSMKQS